MVRYSPHSLLLLALLGSHSPLNNPSPALAHASDGADHDDDEKAEWVVHGTRLPAPLSDHSATLLPNINGRTQIVLAGGCNHPKGNAFVDVAEPEYDYFACETLTTELWAFDPEGEENQQGSGGGKDGGAGEDGDGMWTKLTDMPRERYRHAAVEAKGKLILVGGRTVTDDMIPEIDVYDPATDTWSTPASLTESQQTADNAAFVDKDGTTLYVAGGYYGPDYDTLDRVLSVDLTQLLDPVEPRLEVKTAARLGEKRGDVHAVVDEKGEYAYLAGGFNHLNDFCAPLRTTERFEFETGRWDTVAPLGHGRGDKALVLLNGKMYAIGGETRADDWCDDKEGGNLVRDQSQVMDDVEAFDPNGGTDDEGRWTHIDEIPNARFRFAAAPWKDESAIWMFGGQEPLDVECQCHATSDIVATIDFDGRFGSMSDSGAVTTMASSGGMMASIVATVAGVVYGAAMLV